PCPSSLHRPRRRPPSTLCPYTTLFRSAATSAWPRIGRGSAERASFADPAARLGYGYVTNKMGMQLEGDRRDVALRRASTEALGRDRKSTRLNSSHVKISYAVFCLTKKR